MNVKTQPVFVSDMADLFTPCAKLMKGKTTEEVISLMKDPLFQCVARIYEKKRQRRAKGELQR